jgi:hypothetical protein
MPYRLFHTYRKYGTLEWTSGYDYIWPMMWRDPATVPVEGRYFVRGGGLAPGILAADWHVDAKRLTPRQARALLRKLIRQRPVAWLRYKLPILSRYWFTRNRTSGEPLFGWSYRENGVIGLCLLTGLAGSVVGLRRPRFAGAALWLLAFTVCMIVASIGPSLLIAFEARYLHPLKVFGLFLLPYGLGLALRPRTPKQGEESVHDNAARNRERVGHEVRQCPGVRDLE